MNKKGVLHILGIGITMAFLVKLFIMIFVVGPVVDEVTIDLFKELGSDAVCPEEFSYVSYKVCFNAKGDVIVDGRVNEQLIIQIDGTSDSCHINTGNYDLEYSGCNLDKFKQLSAYNLIFISSKGRISVKGSELVSKIMAGNDIMKINPKGIRSLKKLLYFTRFA